MQVKFIDYQKDYLRFKKQYDAAWESVNMRGDLILRKDVEEFEERLADYVGTKYAVAVSSGTDAIYLSLKSLGMGSDNGIAIPSHTFKSVCGAVLNAGGRPILYDLGEEKIIQGKYHIVAHIAGEIYPMPQRVGIIEDACQALGAIKNPTTSAQCWSFYPAKLLGGKGDSGAVTTNDFDIYEYVKEARNHFKTDNRDFGGNYRIDNLQAALLNVKIQYIDEILKRREEIAKRYLEELKPLEDAGYIKLPSNQRVRTWQDFILRIERRNELYQYLGDQGIETIKNEYPFTPQYPKLPLAAKYESETLRIPCNENLTDEEVNYVIEKINLWNK